MGLQKYTALLKTVELGSISQAAEQMGYTQPAVSRMIARMIADLEEEWGVELLRRSRGGLEMTAACIQLLPILRTIKAECEELDYAVGELHGAHTGLIRVGTFTSVSDMWIPGLLKSFQESYPDIAFDLLDLNAYAEIEDWIRRGKLECGFIRLPSIHDLQAHFLMRDELVAVLPAEHPLAKEPVFPVCRLENATFIKCRERTDFEVSRFLEQIPYKPALRYEVDSDHTILSMVECGIGISIMHSFMAQNPRYRVVCKRLDRRVYRDIAIATAKNARIPGAVRLFVDHVRQHCCGNAEQTRLL